MENKMLVFYVFYALNKTIQSEPKVVSGKTFTDAYVNAMIMLPKEAEITDIILKEVKK